MDVDLTLLLILTVPVLTLFAALATIEILRALFSKLARSQMRKKHEI